MLFVAQKLGGRPYHLALITLSQTFLLVFAVFWAGGLSRLGSIDATFWPLFIGPCLFLPLFFWGGLTALVLLSVAGQLVYFAYAVPYGGLIEELYPDRWRGRMLSRAETGTWIASVPILLACGYVLDRSPESYRYIFPIGALLGVGSALVLRSLKHRTIPGLPPPSQKGSLSKTLSVFREDKLFAVFSLFYFIGAGSTFVIVTTIPIFLDEELKFSYSQFGVARGVQTLVFGASLLFWGSRVDKKGPLWVMCVCWVLMTVSYVVLFLARGVPLVLLHSAIIGIGMAGNEVAWYPVILYFIKEKEDVSRYTALFVSLLGIRGTLGPLVAAFLIENAGIGPREVIVVSTLIVAFGTAGIWTVTRRAGAHPR